MEIQEFHQTQDQAHWLEALKACPWRAGQFLCSLLDEGRLEKLCGKSRVLLLTQGEKLLSFCTLAEKDDIQPMDLTPWVGFVYTFPEFRGRRLAGKLLGYAEKLAAEAGCAYLYISTNHIGLYEKYGYAFREIRKDTEGEDSRIYRKKLTNPLSL